MNANERAQRIRYKLRKNGAGRVRLSVFKSLKHISIQAIDDTQGITLASATTNSKEFTNPKANKKERAAWVGESIAKKLLAKKIKDVYLDRGANAYHGAIKLLAEAARSSGLNF